MMESKLNIEELHMIIAQSLALSTLLVEKFEIMQENGMFVQKAKHVVNNAIPILDNYIKKTFEHRPEDTDFTSEELARGAAIVAEFTVRIEAALTNPDLLTLSQRQQGMRDIIEGTVLFPIQKEELMKTILDSKILNY